MFLEPQADAFRCNSDGAVVGVHLTGVAEAFVCLWRRPYMLQRVNSTTTPKLVGAVLDLLDTDRLPHGGGGGAGETGVVR